MKKSRAFTLIELLITLFIIITLSAVMIPKFYNYDKETKLDIAANEVKEAILETQSLALAPPTTSTNIDYYHISLRDDPENNYQIFEHKKDGSDAPYSNVKNLPNGVSFDASLDLIFAVEDRGRIDESSFAGSQKIIQIKQGNIIRNLTIIKETGQITISP